jgi:hypothetical protein
MLRRHLYYTLGIVLTGAIFLVAIGGGQGELAAKPQDSGGPPQLPASTTLNRTAAHSIPIASSTSEAEAATLEQPNLVVRTKTAGCIANRPLPDRACSPGAVLTTDISVICVPGYSKTVRDVPTSEKQQVFAEYGIDWSLHSGYEVDHVVSLELGGSNDISNLFPEPYSIQYGARIKDKLEDDLHEQVCTHGLPLAVAQDEIATDWLKYYLSAQDNTDTVPPLPSAQSGAVPVISASSSFVIYYTSSYSTAKYYYPSSCNAWKTLSPSYLVGFSSLEALLARYPNRSLSPQC